HYGNTFAVRALDHGVVGDLQLPANQIQSQIFDVEDIGGIALRIAAKKQIGSIGSAANQIIPAIDLQIETAAATSDLRKAVVRITTLRNFADAKVDFLRIRRFTVDCEVQLQVIQVGLAPTVRPPEI